MNDSVFTNVNKFQSITNILDSFLDLFCDWMIHFEPWRMHLNAFCINDATSCNIWKFKLFLSNSLWKELSNGIWFAYICRPPGLALKIGIEIQNLRGLKSRLRLWHENPNGGVLLLILVSKIKISVHPFIETNVLAEYTNVCKDFFFYRG